MVKNKTLIKINCPLCQETSNSHWVKENGYNGVKCTSCGLIYVNPRPVASLIDKAVKTGEHTDRGHDRNAVVKRVKSNISLYEEIVKEIYADVWTRNKKISWLDIGSGYGEFIEAITRLAAPGSKIIGLEPMKPKAENAIKRGLKVKEGYITDINENFEYISLINVFSHIPDFHIFLKDLKKILTKNGEFFIETGNIGDLSSYKEVPTELDFPDHLVFAGESTITKFLEDAGFEIISIKRRRKDDLLNFIKSIIKKLIGRTISLALPYTSKYRTLLIRAKLK